MLAALRQPITPARTEAQYIGPDGKPLSVAFLVALFASLDLPTCDDCVSRLGLCPRHRYEILPKLAQPAWVRHCIAVTYTEQTDVQDKPEEAERKEARTLAARRALAIRHTKAKVRRKYELANMLNHPVS